MNQIPATLQVPGKVYIHAFDAPTPTAKVAVVGSIPGGKLFINGSPRGTVVSVGPIDYEHVIDINGNVVDWLIHSTTLDVLLDL